MRTSLVQAPHYWIDRARRDDRPSTSWSVLCRRAIVRLVLFGVGLVVYGALMPFGADATGRLASVDDLYRRLAWHPVVGVDVFANVLVYIPVGVALCLFIRRRPTCRAREILLATLGALALSATLESLQPYRVGRAGDVNDILANGVGALLGALLAPWFQARMRWVHYVFLRAMRSNHSATVAIGATMMLAASQAMLVLRDVTVQVTRTETAVLTAVAADATVAWHSFEAAVMFCAFAVVGYFSGNAIRCGWSREADGSARTRRWAAGTIVLVGAAVVASLPALSPSRGLAIGTLGFGVTSTAIGLCAAWLFGRRAAEPVPWKWICGAIAAAFVVLGMTPFHRAGVVEDPVGFAWLPLHSAFPRAWIEWLADAGLSAVWLMAGVLLLAVRDGQRSDPIRRLHFGACVLAVYAFAQTAVWCWTGHWTDSVTLAIVLVAASVMPFAQHRIASTGKRKPADLHSISMDRSQGFEFTTTRINHA